MKKHNKINTKIYWLDLIISGLLFKVSFALFFFTGNIFAFLLASIFLYRIGAFTHEIAHQRNSKTLKPFRIFWDYIVGFLTLQPSIRFTKTHLIHHTTGIFATKDDPQYPLIFSDKKLAFTIFVLLPWLLPIYNFIVCAGNSIENNRIEKILYKNIKFSKDEYEEIHYYETLYFYGWVLLIIVLPSLIIPFYLVSVGAWFLSVLRIPLEHPLDEYKETSNYKDQELLSNTYYHPLYILIQPLALRYHKAHHMYPKVPYHNLKQLTKELDSFS